MRKSVPSEIWYCINPVVVMLVLNVLIFYGGTLVYQSFFADAYADADAFMDNYDSIISIICYIAGIVIFYIFYRRDGVSDSDTLIKKRVYIPAVCIFGAAASHGLSILISLADIDGLLGSYEETSAALFASGAVLIIIRTVILAPMVEELVFRGLIFNRIRGFLGFWPAALISAAVFGVYHLNLAQGVYAFLFGMLFCLVYRKFKSLWCCIFMHASANLLSVILELTGVSYGKIWIYIVVMLGCLALAGALYFALICRVPDCAEQKTGQ